MRLVVPIWLVSDLALVGGWGRVVIRRWWGGGAEPGAGVRGVGMVEFVEDGGGLLPAAAGGVGLVGCMVGVAEPDEGGGFLVAVAEVAQQPQGVFVAVD